MDNQKGELMQRWLSHQTKSHTTNVLCPWFLCWFIGSVLTAVTVMLSRGKAPVWSFNEIEALKDRIYCYNRRQPDCDLISSGYFVALFRHPASQNVVLFHLPISSSGYFIILRGQLLSHFIWLFRHPAISSSAPQTVLIWLFRRRNSQMHTVLILLWVPHPVH